jgi:hypothetical protein
MEVYEVTGKYDPQAAFQGQAFTGSIINRRDRIRMVFRAVSEFVDLDAAVSAGLIRSWYPVHNTGYIPLLHATWGSVSLLCDLTFVQPVTSLRSYFGMRIAFLFAWNGFYCKALLALTPLALLAAMMAFIVRYFFDMGGTQMVIVSFSTIVIVWARIAHNLWAREEAYFIQAWNAQSQQTNQSLIRPKFHGEFMPSIQDKNHMEKQYPPSLKAMRMLATLFVTIFFASLVFLFITIWYDIFGAELTLTSGVLLVIFQLTLGVIWDFLTPILTEFENHKHQHAFYDSYIWKNFALQAVNSYASYIYISVKLMHSQEGCSDGSCLRMLQQLLVVVQITLALGDMAVLAASLWWMKFKLWYEVYKYKKANDGKEPPSRPRAEEESMMQPFKAEHQIQFTCKLILSIGFIILFGGVVPIMVPFSLLLFSLHLRIGANVVLNYRRRPFPRRSDGIGAWKSIMELLMRLGVLFSGFMTVSTSAFFVGTPLITKMTGFVLYCLVMRMVWTVVDFTVPERSTEVKILQKQQTHVLEKIRKKYGGYKEISHVEERETMKQMEESFSYSPISRGAWSEIPPVAHHSAGTWKT